jgi:sporulation protein YlmC with PRC-barrel domain
MKKLNLFLTTFVVLALSLTACAPAGQANTPAATSAAATAVSTQSSAATQGSAATSAPQQTPAAGQTQTAVPVAVPVGTKPPQTSAAQIRPPERRVELTRLSTLLQFQVMGLDGATLGKVSDFVINTCETYIVYFVVNPDPSLKIATGNQLVIPFEAVTINSGTLDAQAKAIDLYLTPNQLSGAPAFANPLPLLPTNTWEDGARAYWQQVVRVSSLSSECKAIGSGANPLHKIAYATQLLGANLKDGNNDVLGTVTEGILEPESGKLGFYVVNFQGNQGMILVPLAKTNIPDSALQPGSTSKTELVLLANSSKLAGAPRISSVDQATDAQMQANARGYWGQ